MKRILVVGATGAIGEAICRSLQSPSTCLYVHYFRNRTKAQAICQSLTGDAYPVQADLSQASGVGTLMKQLFHAPDTVVYCAGQSSPQLLQDVTDEEIDKTLCLHLTNVIKLTRTVLPQMIRNQAGVITLVTSIWGLEGASMESVYAAAKSGVHGLIKSVAKEAGRSNVRINGVAPGAIQTDMLSIYSKEELVELAEDIPAGRLGKAEEVADAVSFLSQARASYINGQILSVNGAWHC
ncbi:elongation factor P 5-aminopentanone reductase [Shouchella sp. JSM 1781072]|uniref:elongation factor P 5-aminopentanone reductase n=1 Tax=Shouchella sp. JSM 1781072 TaxID=3344581 RepID=UPI0035C01645